MSFPLNDPHWIHTRSFLEQYAQPIDPILAPIDFLEFFPGTYPYNVSHVLPADHFAFVVIHKGMVAEINYSLVLETIERFHPAFANEVFILYSKTPLSDIAPPHPTDIEALIEQIKRDARYTSRTSIEQPCAAVITTYDRSQYLERSLPQIVKLGVPIVIVDDASSSTHREANQRLAHTCQIPLIYIPASQGLANAINVGVSYWLANPAIDWISYFQDDVEVRPDLLKILARIQHPHDRPLLTGRSAIEHPTLESHEIDSYRVLLKRSTSGEHLHAHRDYWRSVLPIPKLDIASHNGQVSGADADWWITAWSPQSVAKRGGYVVCVPDLVSPFQIPSASIPKIVSQPSSVSQTKPDSVDRASELDGIRILIDGYNLQLTKGTGIKTYGLSLVQALTEMGATVDVLLSRGGYKSNPVLDEVYFFDNLANNQTILTLLKGLVKTASGPLYRARRKKNFSGFVIKRGQYSDDFLKYATSFNLPQCYDIANVLYKKLNITTNVTIPEPIDIWHCTYPLPMTIRGAKKITTVHDMIPLRLPYATLDDKENFYFKVRDALKESAITITVSENSKRDLLTYFDIDPDKIVVTYQPIALQPLNITEEEVSLYLNRFGLEYQSYILFVGAIEPKKNVGRLIDAYTALDTPMPLVVVGKKGWLCDDELAGLAFFEDKTSKKKVKLLEYVKTDSLRYLYRGAYCLVFPSLYEGFGLPPVEAMHFNCPVITSNVSCLPEICGDAALYVDPYSVIDIRQQLETLLGDPNLRDRLVRTGNRVAESFSMENYLKRLHQAYIKALS
ncbi:MAG: glycosyltransferase [Cyanobacteria bacterium RU_5_0]|nr:glycosyltransferase [Cyanobacteria bacterium RU_5_0]